jgi:hypothetical protein
LRVVRVGWEMREVGGEGLLKDYPVVDELVR